MTPAELSRVLQAVNDTSVKVEGEATSIDLDRVQARYDGWYGAPDEYTDPESGDWKPRDDGESISHMIVREDVPELIDEVVRLRARPRVTDAELIQTYLAGVRAWSEPLGTEYQDRLLAEVQQNMPLVDGLRAVFVAGAGKH